MELIKKRIHYVREGKKIFDQFYVDEDYNVPEAKEDVRRIVDTGTELKIEEIRPVENYVRITGKLYFRILYLNVSSDPKPGVLEGKLPFEEMVYAENQEGEEFYVQNVRIEFTPSLIHSRKLSLRAMVELEVGREKLVDEETVTDAEGDVPLYKKMKKVQLLQLEVTKKDTYRIKEEITIPGTKESIGQILFTDISERKLELRPGQDELIVRGELFLFCMYLSGDEKPDWISQTIPYEGRIPCEGISEEMYFSIRHTMEDTLTDLRMDEDGEMRILGIEGTLALHMNFYREESVELLEDLYSLQKQCLFDTTEVVCEELLMKNQSKCKVTERLSLPELKTDVLQILHARGAIQVEHADRTGEGIRVEGILHLSFLYLRGDDAEPYGSWQGMIPFEHQIECKEMPEETVYNMEQHIEQLQITLVGSESVEIKGILTFDTFLRRPVKVWTMENVREEPLDLAQLEKRPSIVGHIVQSGEDLWQLAKQYMTTKEGIMEVNGMQNENVKEGDKLLIFKENMSIL